MIDDSWSLGPLLIIGILIVMTLTPALGLAEDIETEDDYYIDKVGNPREYSDYLGDPDVPEDDFENKDVLFIQLNENPSDDKSDYDITSEGHGSLDFEWDFDGSFGEFPNVFIVHYTYHSTGHYEVEIEITYEPEGWTWTYTHDFYMVYQMAVYFDTELSEYWLVDQELHEPRQDGPPSSEYRVPISGQPEDLTYGAWDHFGYYEIWMYEVSDYDPEEDEYEYDWYRAEWYYPDGEYGGDHTPPVEGLIPGIDADSWIGWIEENMMMIVFLGGGLIVFHSAGDDEYMMIIGMILIGSGIYLWMF